MDLCFTSELLCLMTLHIVQISYIDGDEEILYLRKERWEVIGDSALTDEVSDFP